jgi:Zn-dependent protease with chaperone function
MSILESDRSVSPSSAAVESAEVRAVYFDGQRSVAHPVTIAFNPPLLVIEGSDVVRSAPLREVEITQAAGATPRLIRFADGAFCEVNDADALEALLSSQGVKPNRVSRWQGSLAWVGLAAVLFVVGLVAAYQYAVPALASVAAERVPASFVDLISGEVLSALDNQMLEPTSVSSGRQAEITARFSRLRLPSGTSSGTYQVIFRKSEALGPNAMALPSGTIVVTDELVSLAKADEEIIAVLAHEAGHVVRRHGLRQLFQNSVVALAITWLIGDVSVLAAAAPTALLQANYSRDLEREADAYAIDVLRLNAISPEHFAVVLERLDQSAGEGADAGGPLAYLSSHPVTSERIAQVRESK